MTDQVLYQFIKTRAERSRLFIRMGLLCWVYVVLLFLYEEYGAKPVPEAMHLAVIIIFPVASAILFLVAAWLRRNPATYRAIVTSERFTVDYPGVDAWSFSVPVADIKRFENRQTLGHAGKGVLQHGLLMKDGSFHHINMNYGNNIREMYKAVKSVNPEVTFPYKVNLKTRGLGLDKDYDE